MKSEYNLTYIKINKETVKIAFDIQKSIWPKDPDFDDLYDKAINPLDDNCFFLIYDNEKLIGITGVDVFKEYPDTIWLDWFAILPQFRKLGYGKKVLLDTINYCKQLKKYKSFRIETTYYENRPAIYLYDKVMPYKENYTREDTENNKTKTIIYTYPLKGTFKPWANKYLGLRKYYNSLKMPDD